jgi:hypothetical protein
VLHGWRQTDLSTHAQYYSAVLMFLVTVNTAYLYLPRFSCDWKVQQLLGKLSLSRSQSFLSMNTITIILHAVMRRVHWLLMYPPSSSWPTCSRNRKCYDQQKKDPQISVIGTQQQFLANK